MKKLFTLLALTITFSMNAQMSDNSFAGGLFASENGSVAMGAITDASGYVSTAMGYQTTASGNYSTSMGYGTTASADYSTAMGMFTMGSGTYSTAMGVGTAASGSRSTSMGHITDASGYVSTAMGYQTQASGHYSTSMGYGTRASDYASLVIGQYNSSGWETNNSEEFNTANTAFVIGNGSASNNTSDAFKVMFNGDTTVSNDLTVSGDVVISSDARLKSNIVSLGSTLPKLLQIDGKSYEMKGKQKIGVLAQEIQEVFPELVSEDDNEMLAVNYQGLVPVLINALKEQQSEIETYRDEVSELREMVQELASRD